MQKIHFLMEYKLATEIIKGDIIIDNGIEKPVLFVCVSNDKRLSGAIIIEFKGKEFKHYKSDTRFEVKK